MAGRHKKSFTQALVSFGSVCAADVCSFLAWLFRFLCCLMLLIVIMFSFGSFAPVKRLAGKIVFEMTLIC